MWFGGLAAGGTQPRPESTPREPEKHIETILAAQVKAEMSGQGEGRLVVTNLVISGFRALKICMYAPLAGAVSGLMNPMTR